jgi:hypothetical protein
MSRSMYLNGANHTLPMIDVPLLLRRGDNGKLVWSLKDAAGWKALESNQWYTSMTSGGDCYALPLFLLYQNEYTTRKEAVDAVDEYNRLMVASAENNIN